MFMKGLQVDNDLKVWHKRIGHINLQRSRTCKWKESLSNFRPSRKKKALEFVMFSILRSNTDIHSLRRLIWVKEPFYIVHSNIWGPAQTTTFCGSRYYVTFINDFSRHTSIYPMWQKIEVFRHFQTFKNEVGKAIGLHVRCLWLNEGKEYFSNEFTTYLQKEGIRLLFACWHMPQQNGVDERKTHHILEVARALMKEKNLPKSYWAEAAYTIVYLMNRCTPLRTQNVLP